jgi:hypothetical protein
VETGYTTWRGKMLTELIKTKVFMAKRDFSKGLIPRKKLQKVLAEEHVLQSYITFNHAAYFGKE